jgi:hypothetical protein
MDDPGAILVGLVIVAAVAVATLWLNGRLPVGGTARGGRRDGAGAIGRQRPDRRRSRRQTKPRYGVDELARRLGLEADALGATRASYREFEIPKRTGGTRHILAPDGPTKELQRRILRRLLARLPADPAVHGFERGRSIVTNAVAHERSAVVLKLDIQDFFGATKAARVRRMFRVIGWDREAARILTRLTTWEGGLPTGAPTSPRLANLVNVMLDARLAGLARREGATYTRYADDLTFSFATDDGEPVRRVIRVVRRILWAERYELHTARKLQVRRRWERQLVTGLVVNDRVAVPRSRRRWLRAVEHHVATGRPASLTAEALAGWRGFELMVESQAAESRTRSPAGRA